MRAHSLLIRWSLGLAVLLQACFAPDYPTGIPCSELETCPPGQNCFEGICQAEPSFADPDAAVPPPDAVRDGGPGDMPDAAPDAAPIACTSPEQCNDDIACTADDCVNNVCVFQPDDSACADEVACTADRCDVARGCVAEPDNSACSDGVACTTDRCDVAEGCIVTPDDAACSDDFACTSERCDAAEGCIVTTDDAACDDADDCTTDGCDAATGCVNDDIPFCATQCTRVLIYNDSDPHDLPQRAAAALGLTATVTADGVSFATAFDAGGFDLVIIDSASGGMPDEVTSRVTSWMQASGRLVFSYWDLDASSALAAALGVNTVRELNRPPAVHADPASPVNFFTLFDIFPSPLFTASDSFGDNGDALTLAGAGFIAARVGEPTSQEGAILVTQNNRVIVMGFLPADFFFPEVPIDADGDGIRDAEELYRNEMRFLCAPGL